MNTYFSMLTIDIHAEGRHEAIVGFVEYVEESLVERQAGTEHGSQYDVFLGQGNVNSPKRCHNGFRLVFQSLRQLIGHHFTDTFDVVTEHEAILLVVLVTQFSHILVDNAVLFGKVNYVHVLSLVFAYKGSYFASNFDKWEWQKMIVVSFFNFFNLKKVVCAQIILNS